MIDVEKLKPILERYKEDFPGRWARGEKFKWEAVQHFQDHWKIDAENFGEMFKEATEKTAGLLAADHTLPRGMIINFAKYEDDTVRQMFRCLFDESRDLAERVDAFRNSSEEIRKKYDDGTWRNHFQNTNAISTYLWLMYPDKYYIYKYEVYRDVSKELNSDYTLKRDGSVTSMISGFKMYDEICEDISRDTQVGERLRTAVTEAGGSCYSDPKLRTLTIDFGFYLSRVFLKSGKSDKGGDWFPQEYDPDISVEEWVDLLNDKSVFTDNALQIMKRIKDYGGKASCIQLSVKYGETANFYNSGSTALAKRVAKKTSCELMTDDSGNSVWWTVLYLGKQAGAGEEGTYIWRLRGELSEALDKVDLSEVPLYADEAHAAGTEKRYWWMTANPKIWSFTNIKVGEEQSYTLYNENGNKRRIFQNFLDVRVGDIVIGYEANPVKKIVALAEITQASDGSNIHFKKTEGLATPIEYSQLKECSELEKMEFFVQPNGSLFKLTKGEYDFIMDVIREENPIRSETVSRPRYTKADFLSKVFMDEERLNILEALLRYKKNVILKGAPGVGKTFTAKKLAYVMMGEIDDSRIELVQFHQNYSYEDFIMGYRPDGGGFKLTDGIFYRFCQIAANHPDKEYFFIIDEINRGNLSKIFGELLMLIEKDYRGTKATLAYNGMLFSVPENLYIIGMMNTADRSLANIDYALRRRFSFFEMEPGFDSEGFVGYQSKLSNETFDALINQIKILNGEINEDASLGPGFRIGHSYFCGREELGCTSDWMRSVVEFDIIPMLEEYWFDEPEKLQRWADELRGVFDDE